MAAIGGGDTCVEAVFSIVVVGAEASSVVFLRFELQALNAIIPRVAARPKIILKFFT